MTQRGRRIAFDYGDVRTGVALCDPDGILSSPLCVLESKDKNFLEKISSLISEHEPIRIFVGLPVNMSGSFTICPPIWMSFIITPLGLCHAYRIPQKPAYRYPPDNLRILTK